MNKARLKAYAPQARRDFIQLIRGRADLLGLTKKEIESPQVSGEVAVIEGRPYPKRYAELHKKLAGKIRTEGLEQFIERIAYSWFNRFAALRFMEVNNLLSHGFRVLSNREAGKNEPELLTHAAEIDLPGLDKNKVIEFKLAGNKDAELYRLLLIAQCNELNRAMPFLFERINDETEILLPDNLLATDSVIRKMVSAIDETDWAEVEIIGWLYQFYISEKKDEVIGKTVKSEDIPAATQLFTPNWIVKYMTQNSLGRLWLEANPHSQLAANMEFYIAGSADGSSAAHQSEANDAHPVSIEARKDNAYNVAKPPLADEPSALPVNPEEIKVLDPACGSGHILVEAYELLKLIYTERGYSSRDIPLLILEKNLFGLDIDERAAQLANFALLMKARRDDRRIFERLNQKSEKQIPNILTVPDSSQLPYEARGIAEMFFSREASSANAAMPIRDGNFLFDEMQVQRSLVMSDSVAVAVGADSGVSEQNVIDLLELFEQGKTLGSLIRIPHGFGAVIDKLEKAVETKLLSGNVYEQVAARELKPFVRAGRMLANKYDCVIANPPYMGGKGMNNELKAFAAKNFPDSKSDLFAMFIERGFELLKKDGFNAMVTMESWMFLSSYEAIRERILASHTILCLIHLPYEGRGITAMGISFGISAFVIRKQKIANFEANFSFSRHYELNENGVPLIFPSPNERLSQTNVDNFSRISGSPIAYWVSDKVREAFVKGIPLVEIGEPRQGLATSDNDRFLRFWFEVDFQRVQLNCEDKIEAKTSKAKWFPYSKGGEFRKWFGNNDYVINWENDGQEVLAFASKLYGSPTRTIKNISYYFKSAITWSLTSSAAFGARFRPSGFIFDVNGMSMFPQSKKLDGVLGLLNSTLAKSFLSFINPTMAFQVGDIKRIPFIEANNQTQLEKIVEEAVAIARDDWDSFETSWDFTRLPIADFGLRSPSASVEECWQTWKNLCDKRISRMQELETENNRLFIEAYGLEDELSPEVPLSQITLARADAEKDTRRLLSYFVGCLMGRYSLDQTNLIYADSSGKGFEASNYQTFPADDDGIVPVTDMEWFEQDVARQFEKFIRAAFKNANVAESDKFNSVGKIPTTTPTTDAVPERDEQPSANDSSLSGTEKSSSSSVGILPTLLNLSASRTSDKQTADNLKWIAEQLGGKSSETPLETVRRYFSTSFFKDHLQTYKKRPIYWLFSSGKQKAFECLVYLHRYNESTLPRMRHEYVLPLMSKLTAQVETLDNLIEQAATTSERTKLEKQREQFRKKQTELAQFDEKLRHCSDLKISLDLDDGVKVNYGKFGDLLAEVKKIATTK